MGGGGGQQEEQHANKKRRDEGGEKTNDTHKKQSIQRDQNMTKDIRLQGNPKQRKEKKQTNKQKPKRQCREDKHERAYSHTDIPSFTGTHTHTHCFFVLFISVHTLDVAPSGEPADAAAGDTEQAAAETERKAGLSTRK